MATLAADSKRDYDLSVTREEVDYNAVASDIIYEGAACTMASGADDIGPLNTADVFVGFALRRTDNSSGAAGDKTVRVATKGVLRGLAVTSATANTAPGTAVFASDDDTFTLVQHRQPADRDGPQGHRGGHRGCALRGRRGP